MKLLVSWSPQLDFCQFWTVISSRSDLDSITVFAQKKLLSDSAFGGRRLRNRLTPLSPGRGAGGEGKFRVFRRQLYRS